MITKYYTKQFSASLFETIAEWLNSFEEKRDGRPNCEYFMEVVSYDAFPGYGTKAESIVITIRVSSLHK